MVHQHGQSHRLVRRQRGPKQEEVEQNTQVVVVTLPNTFTGDVVWVTQTQAPKTRVDAPVQATQAPKPEEQEPEQEPEQDPEPKQTLIAPATREPEPKPTSSAKVNVPNDDPDDESSAHSTAPKLTTPIRSIATASTFESLSPTHAVAITSSSIGSLVAATSSSTPSPSASSEAASSSGMSGGAKAGLALGVLLAVGALLGAILFVYHRKKQQANEQKADDEKFSMRETLPPPPPPHVEPAPSIRTERTMSTAPRLSLRPVTEFDPMFTKRKSGGNVLDVAAAGAVANAGNRSPSSDRPATGHSWERFGANNASTASVNPFNDPQPRSVSPVQDPFTNSAAIEEPKASPMAAQHTAPPNADFGNPAPAIAAAEAASLMAALPAPPSKANYDNVPPSPAWTEDIPASPGPAPSGPLPVAAAGSPPNGAAPNNVHRVQLDFKPSMSDELGLRAGQLVRMLHEYDDGWALCVRMDRSQQGVVPRTCLSKHPVKPRQGPPGPRMRGPPNSPPMNQGPMNQQRGPGPQPRPLTPSSGRNSPHPPALSPAGGRMSPAPRSGSPGPRQMPPPQGRARANTGNAPYAGPPRSMSPGPYGGGPQMAPPPPMGRPRSNSAGQPSPRRGAQSGPSRMNPNPTPIGVPMPHRKPLPGQAL